MCHEYLSYLHKTMQVYSPACPPLHEPDFIPLAPLFLKLAHFGMLSIFQLVHTASGVYLLKKDNSAINGAARGVEFS